MTCALLHVKLDFAAFYQFQAFLLHIYRKTKLTSKIEENSYPDDVLTRFNAHKNQPLYISYLGLSYLASRGTAHKNKFPLKNTDRQCWFKTRIYFTEFEKLN